MINAITSVPEPTNEPVYEYEPGSSRRTAIERALRQIEEEQLELTSVIAGKPTRSDSAIDVAPPHRHRQKIATVFRGGPQEIQAAIVAAEAAKKDWSFRTLDQRAAIFLRAAELVSGRYRARINAATMLGQSKTVHQAEIDAACELADFLRFNAHYARRIFEAQPLSSPGIWNRVDYRPLEGFVLAVTPFNFTAISGNLPTAPALMGNTVVWKPALSAALSAHVFMEILIEAGLPPGVINLVHCAGPQISEIALPHPNLGGVHFTGSTPVFRSMWHRVGEGLENYRAYPRLVGETGGKDFIVAHRTADVRSLAVAVVRGAFEYQGQKCSAASRVYVPESLWVSLAEQLEAEVEALTMGDVADFSNFMGAVINRSAFDRIKGAIDFARSDGGSEVWLGGGCDDREGFFIEPTVVLAETPDHRLMQEEIFGPVVTIFKYPDQGSDAGFQDALTLCDRTSPYGLTGAIFARDRSAIIEATDRLRFAAGNFYINDKPTGAVVGQQPFGGARASGTNDKAGSALNLQRWVSPRAIKETLDPPRQVPYPFMGKD